MVAGKVKLLVTLLGAYILHGSSIAQPISLFKSRPPKTFALVIGIAQYENKAIPALRFAGQDAVLFADYLSSPAGGKVPSEQVKILTGKDATISNFYNGLKWLENSCRKGDKVILYFSGHGDVETDQVKNQGYLLAYNTPPHNYRNNAIRIEDINNWANDISLKKNAHVVLITDACHSGKLAGDFLKGNQLSQENLRRVLNNEVRITACGPDELAAEGTEWGGGRGVFSWYLLNGLNGMVSSQQPGIITLAELARFLDSTFAGDNMLKEQRHKQRPMSDGHPGFVMANADPQILQAFRKSFQQLQAPSPKLPAGLRPFKAIGLQPMDYFFLVLKDHPVESVIDFSSYLKRKPSNFAELFVGDCIAYLEGIERLWEKGRTAEELESDFVFASLDSLRMLANQLKENKDGWKRFNELFITTVHTRAQDMVNAYLAGDMEELERRQYYFSGRREYDDFLPMLLLALRLVEEAHYLQPLVRVQYHYLAGLLQRLKMPTAGNTDSLLALAWTQQQKAQDLEPYAAYIHNEMGNLLFRKELYDSADYHFGIATELSPTWAIPWSNRIRLNLATRQYEKAKAAAKVADSLQPDLPFVHMNLGLVREQEGDLLAAQMHYRRAIQNNKVHFLPYERLGQILLKTGEYEQADQFLHDASIRKDEFAVNEDYFQFGVELGGVNTGMDQEKLMMGCNLDALQGRVKEPYLALMHSLMEVEMPVSEKENGIRKLTLLLDQYPNLPYAHHYLGRYYFLSGDLEKAANYLTLAVEGYHPFEPQRIKLHQSIFVSKQVDPADTCMVSMLMYFHYDQSEDLYMLGSIYERRKEPAKSLAYYKRIIAIEADRLFSQAKLEGYEARLNSLIGPQGEDPLFIYGVLPGMYQRAMDNGGYIKAMRLCEAMGSFEEAERILQEQISITRIAGDLRQKAMDAGMPGSESGGSLINFYWLAVNHTVEAVAYDFYSRMLRLFPRDPEWFKKAGLFLHDRLNLAYRQMEPEKYQPFTESLLHYAYPWEAGEAPAEAGEIRFALPVTGEAIIIPMPVYHPVKESLAWMQEYLRLSRKADPEVEVIAALARLHSWTGNTEESIQWYSKWIRKKPNETSVRYEAVHYLMAMQYLVEASKHLDTLYQMGKLEKDYFLTLSWYQALAGRYAKSHEVISHYKSETKTDQVEARILLTKIDLLNGFVDPAMGWLSDSIPVFETEYREGMDWEAFEKGKQINSWRFYSLARLFAMQGDPDKAFENLELAVANGFDLVYVLANDEVWKNSRKTDPWKQLSEKIGTGRTYAKEGNLIFDNPISFRIPNYYSGYK